MKNRIMETKYLEVKKTQDLIKAEKLLEGSFPLSKQPPVSKKNHYYDTFDWRLYRKGLALEAGKQKYSLLNLKNNLADEHDKIQGKKIPAFWQDFTEGRLKEKLKELLDIRALIHITAIERTETVLRILNEDDKTVVVVSLNKIYRSEGGEKIPLKYEIIVNPVRGYNEEFDKVINLLSDAGIGTDSQNLVKTVLKQKTEERGIYSSKLDIKLSSQMSGAEAAGIIYKDLIQTIKQNEEGIKKDTDTEFLHDFRVAVRRIRSALSLVKGVYPKNDVKRFKKEFALLGKKTNRLRDIDVYLLKKKRYMEMLSEDFGGGLEPVFQQLIDERKSEQKKLAAFLETRDYKRTIDDFENYVQKYKGYSTAPNSSVNVVKLSRNFIWKKYSQILKKGIKIDDSSPDPDLHELRIECKKLRYLLEFFSSLFPEKEMTTIIKQLKVLQDNLGDFNDLYVQQKELKNFIEKFDRSSKYYQKVSVSAGGLIALLYQRQKSIRREFSKSFSSFNSREIEKMFEKLFFEEGEALQ